MRGIGRQPMVECKPFLVGNIGRRHPRVPAGRLLQGPIGGRVLHQPQDVSPPLPPTFFMQIASAWLMCFSTILTEMPQ
jgi:hypothetical protein